MKKILVGIAVGIVLLIAMASCAGSEQTEPPATTKADNTGDDTVEATEPKEIKDVTSIKMTDQSEYGISDIRVKYEIKNHSSKKSDYSVEFEIINDATKDRVYDSSVFEQNVKPGQVVTGEDMTTLEKIKGHTLKITSVDRTESF